MSLYTRMAALNVCIARSAGVEFDKAVAVAGETIAQVLQGQHGGRIAQVGPNPLSIDELRKGSINSAVLGAVEVCPNEVPPEVRKKVEEVLKGASGAAPAPAPTPSTRPAPAAGTRPAPAAQPTPRPQAAPASSRPAPAAQPAPASTKPAPSSKP